MGKQELLKLLSDAQRGIVSVPRFSVRVKCYKAATSGQSVKRAPWYRGGITTVSEVLVPESSEVVVLPLEVARIENFPIDFTVRYYFHKVTVPPLQSWTPLQVLVNGARPINGGELSDTFMAYSADEISLHYEASIA